MQECIIQGPYDIGSIIRKLIETESAFILHYPNVEVRVGFHKGDWTFAKVKKNKTKEIVLDYAGIYDGPGLTIMFEIENPITKGLLESLIELKSKDGVDCRETPATILEVFFSIWGGKYEHLQRIEVVKNCRNSFVDNTGIITTSD